MPRLLAFDIGAKRTGIAVTDDMGMIASPLTTVSAAELHGFVRDYTARHVVSGFVVGQPAGLHGGDAESMPLVKNFEGFLSKNFKTIALYRVDERFTSVMAQRAMVDMGMKKSQRREKGTVDAIAAAILLQGFLDSRR
jgi:putative Holliday junction resolvase